MKPTELTAGSFETATNPELAPIRCLERIVVAYPSGNTTAIIFDEITDCNRKLLNKRVMQAWKLQQPEQPEIEQCCIITNPKDPDAIARVEMLGGEFCGNATRSALWLLAGGKRRTGLVEVSGVNRPLIFSRDKEVMLEMPLPRGGELVRRVPEGLLVQLDGIAQLVVTEPPSGQAPRQPLTSLLETNRYNVTMQPAVGVSYYDKTSRKAEFCVWVKDVDTIFDETACGSGTCAIGVAQSWLACKSIALDVIQPSEEVIRTETSYKPSGVDASFIKGAVSVLYDGSLELA